MSLSVSAGCSEITGPVTLVTKEATLCQSKAGPAVLVLCEPGAYCFPRNLVPSLGSRVDQQLLYLSPPQSENPSAVPWETCYKEEERTLKDGDARVMVTEGWLRAQKAGNTVEGRTNRNFNQSNVLLF